METDLKIEREWRGTLQRNLEQEKEKFTHLQSEHKQFLELKKVLNISYICLYQTKPYYNLICPFNLISNNTLFYTCV